MRPLNFKISKFNNMSLLGLVGISINLVGMIRIEKSLIPLLFLSGSMLGQALSLVTKKHKLYLLCFVMGSLFISYFQKEVFVDILSHMLNFYWAQ